MEFDPLCLINIFLAITALMLYVIGSYRFYRGKKRFLLYLGLAIAIDIITATLASLNITPTAEIPGTVAVPWHSILFIIHVVLSTIGFSGFIVLFIYLLIIKESRYKRWIRTWQFLLLLPVWIIGEGIALSNSLLKICCGVRLFEMF
jgi:hypothetical protein